MSAGFFLRIPVRTHQASTGLVVPMQIFIIVSPAAFLAFNYLVYGHLIVAVDGSLVNRPQRRAKSIYSPIPPRLVKHVFVWSDISTFFVQISERRYSCCSVAACRLRGFFWEQLEGPWNLHRQLRRRRSGTRYSWVIDHLIQVR